LETASSAEERGSGIIVLTFAVFQQTRGTFSVLSENIAAVRTSAYYSAISTMPLNTNIVLINFSTTKTKQKLIKYKQINHE